MRAADSGRVVSPVVLRRPAAAQGVAAAGNRPAGALVPAGVAVLEAGVDRRRGGLRGRGPIMRSDQKCTCTLRSEVNLTPFLRACCTANRPVVVNPPAGIEKSRRCSPLFATAATEVNYLHEHQRLHSASAVFATT